MNLAHIGRLADTISIRVFQPCFVWNMNTLSGFVSLAIHAPFHSTEIFVVFCFSVLYPDHEEVDVYVLALRSIPIARVRACVYPLVCVSLGQCPTALDGRRQNGRFFMVRSVLSSYVVLAVMDLSRSPLCQTGSQPHCLTYRGHLFLYLYHAKA